MERSISLFLCGDVMTGRGVDQILPHSSKPVIHEGYLKNAKDYVSLAEKANGPVPKPVSYEYIWGETLAHLKKVDARIINLETSITTSEDYLNKGINYRMHPENIGCLTVSDIDCCTLANNHVLDWGDKGLVETLGTLKKAGIAYAGAGHNLIEAQKPAILPVPGKGRILVFSFGVASSGIPYTWKAKKNSPGVNFLADLSYRTIDQIQKQIAAVKQDGDLVVVSIHWGCNWGYEVFERQRRFAQGLIDRAGVNVIHGHSSHHVKGIELYKNKPILYGCGDLINDYEGISGHEAYRGDLGLLYFICSDMVRGDLISLNLIPTRIKRMQLTEPDQTDRNWLELVLNREGKRFDTKVKWIDHQALIGVYN